MITMSRLDKRGAIVLAVVALAGCGATQSITAKVRGAADGTLAQSVDGTLLYAVSADDNALVVVDPTAQSIVATVAVGQSPSRVVVGPDDTIYVSNRAGRSVSVIHRGTWTEASRITVGVEPMGLALSPDGSALFVANHASGTVQSIDLTAGTPAVSWQATVNDFPRGVAAFADGRLYVSHERSGMVDVLDSATGVISKSVSTAVGTVPALTKGFDINGNTLQPTFRPTALDSIVPSHDGKRAYLVHRRERSGIISDSNFVPTISPAITTFELSTDTPDDDAVTTSQNYPPTIIYPDNRSADITVNPPDQDFGSASGSGYGGAVPENNSGTGTTFGWTQGPSSLVEDPQGNFLYVANVNSGNVTVLPANRRSGSDAPGGIVAVITVGDGPTGLALSSDQTTLFVHNALSHSISIVNAVSGSLQETNRIEGVGSLGALTADVNEGRRLFFSASDATMSAPGSGVSCESCHVEGGTDGNVWQFVQGPRKTPGLLGKQAQNTSPYHWDGTEDTIHNLMSDTVLVRMGGTGADTAQEQQVLTYIGQLAEFDNPQRSPGGLTAQQLHGQTLFLTSCSQCHAGTNLTDNSFHDVGTTVTNNPNGAPDDLCRITPGGTNCIVDSSQLTASANPKNLTGGFNTPTMLGVFFSGPYLHDGSAQTLNDVIKNNTGPHGNTQGLSPDDQNDLVAYLETL
jgi:YVTN family beta-propeller protein